MKIALALALVGFFCGFALGFQIGDQTWHGLAAEAQQIAIDCLALCEPGSTWNEGAAR